MTILQSILLASSVALFARCSFELLIFFMYFRRVGLFVLLAKITRKEKRKSFTRKARQALSIVQIPRTPLSKELQRSQCL